MLHAIRRGLFNQTGNVFLLEHRFHTGGAVLFMFMVLISTTQNRRDSSWLKDTGVGSCEAVLVPTLQTVFGLYSLIRSQVPRHSCIGLLRSFRSGPVQ